MEIQTIAPFLDYFEKIRRRTVRVARCIPADLLEWTYAPGKFTFGDEVHHRGQLYLMLGLHGLATPPL